MLIGTSCSAVQSGQQALFAFSAVSLSSPQDVTYNSLIEICRRFGWTHCLHIQGSNIIHLLEMIAHSWLDLLGARWGQVADSSEHENEIWGPRKVEEGFLGQLSSEKLRPTELPNKLSELTFLSLWVQRSSLGWDTYYLDWIHFGGGGGGRR